MTAGSEFDEYLAAHEWVDVAAGVATLGSARRGVLRAFLGPRHEVRVPNRFEITRSAIPVAELLSHAPDEGPSGEDGGSAGMDRRLIELGARPPTEAEWTLAEAAGAVHGEADTVELLIDWISERGYWSLPCDGRPRLGLTADRIETTDPGVPMNPMHAQQRLVRIWSAGSGGAVTSRASLLPPLDDRTTTVRLVRPLAPSDSIWSSNDPPRLPAEYDRMWRLRQEVVIALLVGIIPSFIWAWFNATPGYIASGWLNLVMGGIFIGVLSGAVWRPDGPTYRISEDGKRMRPNRRGP